MDSINDVIISDNKSSIIKYCKKGDLVSFYYNSVGNTVKTKQIIGIFMGYQGKGRFKMVKVGFKKHNTKILLKLPVSYPFMYGFKIL